MNKKCGIVELFSAVSIAQLLSSSRYTDGKTEAIKQHESHKTAVYKHFNLFISVSIRCNKNLCINSSSVFLSIFRLYFSLSQSFPIELCFGQWFLRRKTNDVLLKICWMYCGFYLEMEPNLWPKISTKCMSALVETIWRILHHANSNRSCSKLSNNYLIFYQWTWKTNVPKLISKNM